MKSVAIIIPARLDSKRFPNKPLALIDGVPMIKHVHDICQGTIGAHVYVATEDEEIAQLFDYNVINASGHNGTARCMNAAKHLDYDVIINVQGDFVGVTPIIIEDVIEHTKNNPDSVVTAHTPMDVFNPNDVHIIQRRPKTTEELISPLHTDAVWFTRNHIQYGDKHLGIYGFSRELLMRYGDCVAGENEIAERLEQIRWIDMGIPFKSVYGWSSAPVLDINSPSDLEAWHATR